MNDEEIEKIADLVIKKSKEVESIDKEDNRLRSLYLNRKCDKDKEAIDLEIKRLFEASKGVISSGRIEKKDVKFFSQKREKIGGKILYSIENLNYSNYLFIRAVATDFLFINIDFSKTIFDSCYLKDCRFLRCTFEGAKFMNSNLQGSYFEDCKFDYVTFEKTFVDDEILSLAPKNNNLKFRFARSLKLNYASIGDYIKASEAVKIEMKATKAHLLDTWSLNDEYHKYKYGGIRKRFKQFWKWIKVSLLDFVWGNGESLWRLIRFNLIIFMILTIYDIIEKKVSGVAKILRLFVVEIPSNYFGLKIYNSDGADYFDYYPPLLSLILNISRLVCFGLLMSIIIKKYNRR